MRLIEELNKLVELEKRATPRPWDSATLPGTKVFAGNMNVCDIRGWGYLTGTGALHLPEAEAIAIQEANGNLIPASRNILPELLAVAKAAEALREGGSHRELYNALSDALDALQKKLTGADGEDQPK